MDRIKAEIKAEEDGDDDATPVKAKSKFQMKAVTLALEKKGVNVNSLRLAANAAADEILANHGMEKASKRRKKLDQQSWFQDLRVLAAKKIARVTTLRVEQYRFFFRRPLYFHVSSFALCYTES